MEKRAFRADFLGYRVGKLLVFETEFCHDVGKTPWYISVFQAVSTLEHRALISLRRFSRGAARLIVNARKRLTGLG